ncbi:SusC/RagA family TonB-linked outer membrane protein [Pedobacter deserti]|uniref:SusC/RagA family TonB-linked outer membrane protein n=1 Tax=Pedobacter deserti TaxID=2817382 RepID=UPI00210CA42A|nr:TonB-dependent receptor [Pedobacter sp. SYSU D00382]
MKRIPTKLSVFVFLLLLFAGTASAQNITITGTVIDAADKSPLPGVGVLVKGTQIGTTTSSSGAYSINAPADATLVFTYIGFTTQEVAVGNRTTINITLAESAQDLEAVVVVGYGTQRRRDVTGSISTVSGDELANRPATNPISSLQGRVAGLTVVNSGSAGETPTVRIRGVNSTNSANPIYVVDGIIQDNIDYLNPGDIESIDLLRDPSSIAIYGLRGANGVIAVTTRKAARGKTTVNLQSQVGLQHVSKRIGVANAQEFQRLYNTQLANLNAAPFDFSNYTGNTNWQDLILRSAATTTNTLTISNGGEKSSTLISLGYNNQEGVVKYNNFKKYIARINEEINVTNGIKLGANLTGFHWNRNPSSNALLNNAIWAAPVVPVREGDLYYAMPSFQRAQVGNPVAALDRNNRTSIERGYRFTGSLFGEIKFLDNFTWRSTVYTDLGFNNVRGYSPLPFSFINVGENGNPNQVTFDETVNTSVRQSADEFRRYQQDHTLTYDKDFENGHRLTGVIGFTTVSTSQTLLNASRTDTTLNVPNNPNYWYLGVVNLNNVLSNGGSGAAESNAGAFARLSYSFQNKYLLNATIRRDGSSKFAPENRWGTFGSVGLGWVLSEEDFFKTAISGIEFMKIRGAWGRLGNSNISGNNLYQAGLSVSSTAVFGDNVYGAVQPAYTPDPNLHFEIVQGIDLGLDIRALDSRFNTELNLYNKTTNGILTTFPLPGGLPSYFTNLGKITNKGIEVNMGWNDAIGENITYGVSGNFSYNKNIVNSLGNATNFQILGNGGINVTESGRSIGYFFGYRQAGIYQSAEDIAQRPALSNSRPGDIAYEDTNGDGTITTADRVYLGTPFPPYSFGLNLSFGYRGFDALIEGQGVAGNHIYTQRRTAQFAVLNYESNRLNAWTGPGTSNTEPILDNTRGNNYLFSTYFLEPGDYFRLRTVQLGYTFDKNTFSKIGIQNARIFVSAQNLATWTKVSGYSPEAQIGNITAGGADNGVYPVPAIYSLGLNVNF